MSESRDMDAPVTRRELHETLDLWGGAFEQRMIARMDERMDEKFRSMEERFDRRMLALFEAFEQRFTTELRAQIRGSAEAILAQISVIDEKYKDLPARVARLEAKVFAPAKRRRRRAD